MSVALTTPPPALSFSGDRIVAEFTCTDIFSQVGVKAINKITIPDPVPVGHSYVLKWGGKTVTMTAAAAPDTTGDQFQATDGSVVIPIAFQVGYFQANYKLSKDFDISVSGSQIVFSAKAQGTAFNIAGYTTTAGVIQTIKSNYGIQVRLYCENAANTGYELINESLVNVQIGANNIAEAPIGDKLHSYISDEIRKNMPDIPTGSLLCAKSCRRYYFEYAEAFDDQFKRVYKSEVYTVLHGSFSAIGQATKQIINIISPPSGFKRFLKQGGNLSSTRVDQKQYLFFYNSEANFNAFIKCRLRFTDGTKVVVNFEVLTLLSKRKYAFNVSYDKVFNSATFPGKTLLAYEIWINNDTDAKISETQTFLVDKKYKPYLRYFLNWSSWGSFDSRTFYGKGSLEFDLTQSVAEKGYYKPSQISKGASTVYNTSLKSKFSLATGFIQDRRKLLFNRDFFVSPLKYRSVGTELLPIVVTSKTIPELNDGPNLYAQKFEYEYLFDDHAYTEGDILEPGLDPIIEENDFGAIYLTDQEKVFLLTTDNQYITLS